MPDKPYEVLIAWRSIYHYSDDEASTVDEAVANAKEAMRDEGVMDSDTMKFLASLRGDGHWEVSVNGEVVEESKE